MFETFSFVRQGGWPMIPLALCSVAALTIVIERMLALRRNRVMHPGVVSAIDACTSAAGAESVLNECAVDGGALARIAEEVIHARHHDPAHQIEILNAAGRREIGRLERGLVVLEIVAGVSPLIGLLGTVLGMVTVFDAIAAQGMGDPQVLSEGISKALVTTVAGLCVAIPSLGFHSYLSSLVETFGVDMHDRATTLTARLRSGRA